MREGGKRGKDKGTIPKESVDVSDSPAGEVSTLTSLKPVLLKPTSIFDSGKYFIPVFIYLLDLLQQSDFLVRPIIWGSNQSKKLVQQNIIM